LKRKTFAELQKRHDKLAMELVVLSQATDALKAAQRKLKRAKK
jgi:hypothetical protein